MIGDIYALNGNLEVVGLIDIYISCIWANRYDEEGDCELYLPATSDMFELMRDSSYLMRRDDDMVCRIVKVELTTDAEDGDHIIVTGVDAKTMLDQRIIWSTEICNGLVEAFVRDVVSHSCIASGMAARNLVKPDGDPLLLLGELEGFAEKSKEQVTYKNLGDFVRELCKRYQWGYAVKMRDKTFYFELYKGIDRTGTVIFSDAYENLASTSYVVDMSHLGNIALIAGEGEGADRQREVVGSASGTERYEIYVDAKDISKKVTYGELLQAFPGGTVQVIDGVIYYVHDGVLVAVLETEEPEENDTGTLTDGIYGNYLMTRGQEKLSEYGETVTFEGQVVPDVTFSYRKDFWLGDLVRVRNSYGVEVDARIVEVVEVMDDSGYSIEPKFEYQEG